MKNDYRWKIEENKDVQFMLQKLEFPQEKEQTLITQQNKENHLTSNT